MRKIVLAALFAVLFHASAWAQAPGLQCPNLVPFNTSSSGALQLVALSSGASITICGIAFFAGGTTAPKLQYGTGSACGTGTTDITPAMPFTAQTGFSWPSVNPTFILPLSNALCLNNGSAAQITGWVTYKQN